MEKLVKLWSSSDDDLSGSTGRTDTAEKSTAHASGDTLR
jgi:hypothetical protein